MAPIHHPEPMAASSNAHVKETVESFNAIGDKYVLLNLISHTHIYIDT